jgi:DNA-binding NtrC family response regulator
MKTPLNILHLEDDVYDAALVHSTLRESGILCTISRIETYSYFISALAHGGLDLILADYTLPAFDGLAALIIAQHQRPELPFIFVSGTLGEDQAIDTLKSGASDYILKKNLSRLPAAIFRTMEEVEARAKRRELAARAPLRKGLVIPPQRTGVLPYPRPGY